MPRALSSGKLAAMRARARPLRRHGRRTLMLSVWPRRRDSLHVDCQARATRTSGEFFRLCTQGKRNTYTRVDSRTVSFSNKEQIQAWVDDYGEDSDFVRVRVKGQFPRAGYNLSALVLWALVLLLVGEQILAYAASYHVAPGATR